MNFSRLKNINLFYPNTVAGVSLFAMDNNVYRSEIVILKRQKKQIVNISKEVFIGSIDEIIKQIPEKTAISLSIDGKGILFKEWEEENTSKEQIFRELLPQGNYGDFYLQIHSSLNKQIVGIARKNHLDTILKTFENAELSIIDLILGPFILNQTVSFVKENDVKWILPNRTIVWEGGIIESFNTSDKSLTTFYTFGDELVSSEYLISFSQAFWVLISPTNLHNDIDRVVQNRNNQYYKKAINYVGTAILSFYLVLLIVNYLLFSSYSLQLNQTYDEYESSLKIINKLEQYTTDLQQKEILAKKVGLGARIQLSYFADRIAATLPSYINLIQLEINPLDSKRQRKNTPEFVNGEINISGNITNGVRLYKWIEKLKKLPFIQYVEVIELNQDEALKPAFFIIEIQYSSIQKQE